MKSILRNYLVNLLVIVLFTGLALWFALHDNTEEIIAVLKQVSVSGVFLVLACALFYHMIVGWILQQFGRLAQPSYTFREGFVNALVAAFFHGITPSASGGQVAQVFVFHKQGIPVEKSASILIMDFIVYQGVMLILSALLLLLRYHYFADNSFFLLALAGFLVNLGVIALLMLCTFSPHVYTWVTHKGIAILSKLHIIKDKQKVLDGLHDKLDSFASGLREIRKNPGLLLRVAAANALRLLVYFSIPLVCAYALHITIPLSDVITVIALTSFVTNVNAFIPIPGASGGTESTFVLMYSMIVSGIAASSIMVLWRFTTYHFIMLIGAAVFIRVQNSKTRVIKKEDNG